MAMLTLLIGFCVNSAHAHDTALPVITVWGTATTEVIPDEMHWYLTVRNKGVKLSDVADDHSRIVSRVLKFLKDNGIADDKVQTARMEFGENWEYRKNNRVKEGYYASTSITFDLDDFAKYKGLWFGLAQIQHVGIDSVSYDSSKRIMHQNETRKKALTVAREKAKALANALGSQIGEPLLIEEDMTSQSAYQFYSNSLASDGDGTADANLAPGRIPIQMRVKVSFRLITTDG
ncbi:MAG: SIMPL domain-containing protein [Planctomycetes bacterium]|nr:SIMPL domain-containing protein [Planctomycetota bacterium]